MKNTLPPEPPPLVSAEAELPSADTTTSHFSPIRTSFVQNPRHRRENHDHAAARAAALAHAAAAAPHQQRKASIPVGPAAVAAGFVVSARAAEASVASAARAAVRRLGGVAGRESASAGTALGDEEEEKGERCRWRRCGR